MLLRCSLTKEVWHRLEMVLNINLSEEQIILGDKNDVSLNYILTFVSYEIYKFWLIATTDHRNRTVTDLLRQIQIDIYSKINVLNILSRKDLKAIHNLKKIKASILF